MVVFDIKSDFPVMESYPNVRIKISLFVLAPNKQCRIPFSGEGESLVRQQQLGRVLDLERASSDR